MLPLVQLVFEEPAGRPDLVDEPLIVHQRTEKTRNRALLVFVHGLGGSRYGVRSTWGNLPKFVFEDFPPLDVGLYEFRTLFRRLRFWESVTLQQEAEVFAGILRDATQYTTLLLAGHSMGGLLCMEAIRYFLKSNQSEELRRVAGLFLMATPQAGSERVPGFLARFSKDFRALKPHGDFVTEIQRAFTNYVLVDENASAAGKEQIPAFAILGSHDQWVDGLSAGLGIPDRQTKAVRGSHTQIVKPPNKGHDGYQFLRASIEHRLLLGGISSERKLVRPYLESLLVDLERRSYSNLPRMIPLSTQQGRLGALPAHQQGLAMDAMLLPRTSAARPHPQPDASRPEVPVEQFLCENTRILLLGPPGAGKSTILRHLVQLFGNYWISDSGAVPDDVQPGWWGRIPIFASLNQWQEQGKELLAFVQDQIRMYGTPELAERLPELMQQGRVVLLLDGLNELPQLSRDGKRGLINDPRAKKIAKLGSTTQDREVGCVLSCRVKDFAGGPRWRDLHVLSLEKQQVEEFAKAFYQDIRERDSLARSFLSELYDSADLKREKLCALAAQPFFLLGLLYYFQQDPAHKLSDKHSVLLDNTVRVTLARAKERELLSDVEADELEIVLRQLAFNMTDAEYVKRVEKSAAESWLFHPREQEFQDGTGGYTPQLSAAEEARASELLKWAEATGLLHVAQDEVEFHHEKPEDVRRAFWWFSSVTLISVLPTLKRT